MRSHCQGLFLKELGPIALLRLLSALVLEELLHLQHLELVFNLGLILLCSKRLLPGPQRLGS